MRAALRLDARSGGAVLHPGIVPALYQLAESLCAKGEKVLISTPAYGYFLHAAEYTNVEALTPPLQKDSKGEFHLDFEDFEKKCADPKCKLVFWCSPHTPTGRVWTVEEQEKIAAIVEKYNLWIVSDEIHCDLTRNGIRHMPMAKIMPNYKKLITCMAPTKSFNMADFFANNADVLTTVIAFGRNLIDIKMARNTPDFHCSIISSVDITLALGYFYTNLYLPFP